MSNEETHLPLRVRRVLTGTPLAKTFARSAGPRVRAVRKIPWAAFDRSLYPEPALALATDAMMGLARGEYDALDAFSRLASALARSGVPFDLVSAATEIPTDEIRHADLALRMGALYAGQELTVDLDRQALGGPWPVAPTLEELDAWMLQLPTISETLAAGLIDACREVATDPVAKALFSSILADEVHHLRLGWYYLAWREPQWSRAERQRAADVAAESIVLIERQFWQGRDAPRGSRRAAEALGVLDSKTQQRAVRHLLEHDLVPGLDALGLGASHAFRMRLRGKG